MKQLTISEVKRRASAIRSNNSASYTSITEGARMIKNGSVSDIKRFINNIKSCNNVPFNTYLELYDAIIEKGNKSDIESIGYILSEAAATVSTPADPAQAIKNMAKAIKARRTRALNKIYGHTSNNQKAIDAVKDNYKTIQTPTPTPTSNDNNSEEVSKQEVAIRAYDNMLETLNRCEHCDRIFENYERISKRFNLEVLFSENSRVNGVEDTVVELCNLIDTYNMPKYIKFSTIVETAWYGLSSYNIEFNKHDILETAIDYFRFLETDMSDYKAVMDASLIYDKEDMKGIDVLTEEEPEEYTSIMPYHKLTFAKVVKEDADFDEIFKKFKEEELSKEGKPESKLKNLVNKLYRKNVHNVVEQTPHLLSWIRKFFIVGSAAIPVAGPVIMIVGFIADKFIELHHERDEVEKMIKCFDNEIEASKKKLNTTKDKESKEKLEKYIKSLEDAQKKIESHRAKLYTDDELYGDDSSSSDDDFGDFDWGDDDDLLEFNEMLTVMESVYYAPSIDKSDIYKLPFNLTSNKYIMEVAKLVKLFPNYLYKESFVSGLQDALISDDTRYISESPIDKSLKKNTLRDALDLLSESDDYKFEAKDNFELIWFFNTILEAHEGMQLIISAMHDSADNGNTLIYEASISNTLKLASMKIKNVITKMNDKQKGFYKSIDVGVNNLKKGAEKALANDNREAVIKGSVLPSASKIVKLGIVNAGLLLIGQPILAVITTLGYLGASSKFKAKERQMIIDEIEIELKMCQKYIDIAESKNDMKALKELLMIQRNLERQHQRIKYKMNVKLGQKVYDTSSSKVDN